jgi:hypothetical protein
MTRVAAQQAMCVLVHYRAAETTVPAAFSELHLATSAKLACKNDQ